MDQYIDLTNNYWADISRKDIKIENLEEELLKIKNTDAQLAIEELKNELAAERELVMNIDEKTVQETVRQAFIE